MIGENRQLVTNELVKFEKIPVEVQAVGKLLIILKECMECIEYTRI